MLTAFISILSMQNKAEKITLIDIDDLVPYEKNPNKHSDEQIDEFVRQFEYQGFRTALVVEVVNGKNVIMSGVGRWMGAKKWGKITKLPCLIQEFQDDTQRYLFVVADNGLAKQSSLDYGMINLDIQELGPFDIELLAVKDFTIEPLDKLVDSVNRSDESAEWVDMPEFNPGNDYIRIILHFGSEESREDYVEKNNLKIDKKLKKVWLSIQ